MARSRQQGRVSNRSRASTRPIRSVAVVSNRAFSLKNFRGPLIEDLVSRAVYVYALAPDYTPELRKQIADLGAYPIDSPMDRTGLSPVTDALNFLRLANLLRKISPDATFAYFVKPVIYGSLAAHLVGVPRRFALIEGAGYVFMKNETSRAETLGKTLLRWFTVLLYRCALTRIDSVFVLNSTDQAQFVERRLVNPRKICRLPGIGVDLEEFQNTPPAARPVTFLLVARLLVEKGVREYVKAARLAKAHDPDIRFLLVGDTDVNPGSLDEAEVASWAAEGLVEWPGWVEDVRPWIARSSVFVLPSYREGVPRSTQEAMAMGRPVITTDAPGCRETVVEGENGFLVPVRDAEALAEAMLRFVERPELIPRMGAASRRLAERKFDVHEVNRVILGAMGL